MAKKNYLIEGVSGTGKSSVCEELKKRGYHVVNGDKELAYNGDPETGAPVYKRSHQTWIWDVDKVKSLIDDQRVDVLFFCGGSRNFHKFIDDFDQVFVLDADDATIRKRLLGRPGDVWGKNKQELAMVLKLNKTKEDVPNQGVLIDATKPLHEVVDCILNHIDAT